MSILLENITIIPMNGENSLIEKGYIITEGQFIKTIGEGTAPQGSYEKVIDGSDRVVLPGFINTHTHAAMTLLRGYADDLPLMEWLENKVWPLEAKLTAEDVYWGTMLAIVEMIKSGTTTFTDMYFFMDEAARAAEISGMRAVLCRGMVGVGPENELAMLESPALIKKWHGAAGGRIAFRLGPHAPYTCPPDYMARVLQLASELRAGIIIHLAETRVEFDDMMKLYGKTPVAHLEALGVFEHEVLAAHCVHVTPEDIDILKKHSVAVAHNPESNMKLASGIAPVPEMLNAGIPVSLGTDGASSNNNLDMLQEMRSCAFLHKVNSMNPTVIPAYQAMEMATVNGAISLGLGEELGRLKPGMKADMIIMSLKAAHMIPRYDILANIVYSAQASDVETVIIDGQIIMEDRLIKAFDEAEVLTRSQQIAERLVKG
ncbi:MAG: amidohydrolase [Syntrophomonadaceae bacterium]|nr:amidohydrolase [Syntrophomonadaceae bacterium]MDD3023594.1 amidohydrolase [Syntrophomonadaceae bacterium]